MNLVENIICVQIFYACAMVTIFRFLIEEWNNSIIFGVYDEYKIINTTQEITIHNISCKRMQVFKYI